VKSVNLEMKCSERKSKKIFRRCFNHVNFSLRKMMKRKNK
jgi:hypothetical protein